MGKGGSKTARFSVVVPLFNKRRFIARTLDAALSQSHPSFEIIVVDDGSTDGSAELVAAMTDPRLRLIRQENAGPGPARNRGIAEAKGEWIAFLDADDIWLPHHLATLDELARKVPTAAAVAAGFRRQPAREPLPAFEAGPASVTGGVVDYFEAGARGEPVWTSCAAVRRDTCLALGGFGAFWPGEDMDFWARLALDHSIATTPVVTALYLTETGGLMDQSQAASAQRLELQPVFATLDTALADPGHSPRHGAIRRYRNSLLHAGVRQAVYRGHRREALDWIRALRAAGERPSPALRLARMVPGPVLRAAARAYSAVKRRFF